MNGITVPKQYRQELRDTRSKEYKEAEIRDYVKAHKGEIMTISDFQKVAGTTAQQYIARLRKEGKLLRKTLKTGNRGYSYTYDWMDIPYVAKSNHGEIKITKLGFDNWPLGSEHTNGLMTTEMDIYIQDNIDSLPAESIKGMLLFKKHINRLYTEVAEQRKIILEGEKDEKNQSN